MLNVLGFAVFQVPVHVNKQLHDVLMSLRRSLLDSAHNMLGNMKHHWPLQQGVANCHALGRTRQGFAHQGLQQPKDAPTAQEELLHNKKVAAVKS